MSERKSGKAGEKKPGRATEAEVRRAIRDYRQVLLAQVGRRIKRHAFPDGSVMEPAEIESLSRALDVLSRIRA